MDQTNKPIHVFKFGGSSVATAERMRGIAWIVADASKEANLVVVVSALGGVTDELDRALNLATTRSGDYSGISKGLRQQHVSLAQELIDTEDLRPLLELLDGIWAELDELLEGISLLQECTARTRDAVIGLGERASAPILTSLLSQSGLKAAVADARTFIHTDDAFGEANVDMEATRKSCRDVLGELDDDVVVVPGFIATSRSGAVSTLGRSGSDLSATVIASCLDAEQAVIWTDVDGVMSADPRLVPSAFTLQELSYREAAELAWFGARVLHPRTMRPLRDAGIPLVIRNTMNPEAKGTLISPVSSDTSEHVKAVTSVPDLSLVMLEGTGMMGIPGIAARTFSALADEGINVLLISQASSEQSICIGIRSVHADAAVDALAQVFELELSRHDISRIYTVPDCSVVALVGDQMRLKPGLAGSMFSTLGRANINVLAIAQGAAETNISAVVAAGDTERAVRALHEMFARSVERVHLFLAGPGLVGRRLLELLEENAPLLSRDHQINLRLVGIANSRRMCFDPEGIQPASALERLERDGVNAGLDELMGTLRESHLERLLFVDATASETVTDKYPEILAHGIGIVTPNKRANTRDQAFYDLVHARTKERNVPFLYETTVGAALPLIRTMKDLVRSGDGVHRIQGILSGTLAFVFNSMREGRTFSQAVLDAHENGYTEPDPRDDLSGEDVARKLLTLAREAGRRLERDDIEVESLVSDEERELSIEAFLARLPNMDAEWARRTETGPVQLLAVMDEQGCRVSVETIEPGSPFDALRGTDNMVVFETDVYTDRPLVIQGAGAGPVPTAAGILNDILIATERMR